MALKRPPRRKVMKVYDLKGNEHTMSVLNARDMVQHNNWTFTPPVIRTVYVDKSGAPVNGPKSPESNEVPEADEEAEEPLPPVGFHDQDDEGEGDQGEDVELLNDTGTPDAEEEGEEEIVIPNLGLKTPSTLDPTNWSKAQIVKYAQDKYSTKLDGRHGQMELVNELMELVNALG